MSTELILGIIGTATGIFGTIISLYSIYLTRKRMQREKPVLSVKVLDCRHKVSDDSKSTVLYLQYVVHNMGDRGTHLNEIDAVAVGFNGKPHHVTRNIQEKSPYLNANDNKTLFQYFYFSPPFQYSMKMKCSFRLHTTHEVVLFDCESNESATSLGGPNALSNAAS